MPESLKQRPISLKQFRELATLRRKLPQLAFALEFCNQVSRGEGRGVGKENWRRGEVRRKKFEEGQGAFRDGKKSEREGRRKRRRRVVQEKAGGKGMG